MKRKDLYFFNLDLFYGDYKCLKVSLKKIFGSYADRYIKKLQPVVDGIASLEESCKKNFRTKSF